MKPLLKIQMIALAAMLGGYMLAFMFGARPMTAGIAALAGIFAATGLTQAPWLGAVSITAVPAWFIGLYALTGRNVTAVSIVVMSAVVAAGLAVLAVPTSRDLKAGYGWTCAALLAQAAAIEGTLGWDSPFPALAGIGLLYLIGRLEKTSGFGAARTR